MEKTIGNTRTSRIVTVLLVLTICFGMLAMPRKAQAQTDPDGTWYDKKFLSPSEVSLTDWMAKIPDEALITEINIPGTHDSGTYNMADFYAEPWACCVNEDIAGQLKNGNRVFDIRVSGRNGYEEWHNMAIVHNFFRCKRSDGDVLMLYDVIRDCEKFLKDHKDETVILYLAPDGRSDDKDPAKLRMGEMRRDCNYKNGGYCLHSEYNVPLMYYCSGDPIPTLKQVRGRIVVIDDMDEGDMQKSVDKRRGVGFSYEMHYQEDDEDLRGYVIHSGPLSIAITRAIYCDSVLNIKYNYMRKFMTDAREQRQEYTYGHGSKPGVFTIENYSNEKGKYGEPGFKYSGTNVNTFGRLYPLSPVIKEYSGPINQWLNRWTWKEGARYGWVTMDHPTESLIRKIIATNEIKTTEVQVDINHFFDFSREPTDISWHIAIGGKTYPGNAMSSMIRAYLTLLPEIAEQLEAETLDIGIDSKCSIWSSKQPITVNFVHVGENHWRCDVYPEIKVALKWDYAEPPAMDVLKNKFFTARYEDGTECVIDAADVRVEKNTADGTVLYLHLLPEDRRHGKVNIDLNPSGGAAAYRYDKTADKQMEGLLSWVFTLHNGGECVNLEGTVIFDDNNNEANTRAKKYPIHLIAAGTKTDATTGEIITEPMLLQEQLSFDCENPNWERKYLPVTYGGYALTWDLMDDQGGSWSSYTISHVKNGTQFTSTFTLHPLYTIKIKWVGDDADTSYRPSSLEIHTYRRNTGSYSLKKVYASQGWELSFRSENIDDWDACIWDLPATYKCEGPVLSADGKEIIFTCIRQYNVAIKSNVDWYDGETRALDHPTVSIALSNGKETVTTRTAGGNTRLHDTIDFGLWDSTDERKNPYHYSIAINGEAPSGYIAVINGFDITFIRTGTVFGFFNWYDSASRIPIDRPSWIKEDPQVTLLERVYGREDQPWIINGAEPTVDLSADRFDFGTIPFGIINNDDRGTRRDFHLAVDISKIPGAASASITKPAPIGGNNFRCSGTVKIVMEPANACVPFTINAADEGYHPEKTFTVSLVNSKNEEIATRDCTVKQNAASASFQFEFEKKALADEDYKLRMKPVVGDDRWTGDSEEKTITLSVHYNEETDTIEATPTGDDPVFHVSYKHDFKPVTVEVKFPVKVINASLSPTPPAESFKFVPYVNGTKGTEQFLKDGEAITLSASVSAPGEVTFNVDQVPSNSMLWIFDTTERALRVKVSIDPANGTLVPDYTDGRENTFENIYLGDKVNVAGTVFWNEQIDDQDVDATSMRPEAVTLELTPFYTPETLEAAGMDESDVEVLSTLTVPVTKDSRQSFDFGLLERIDRDGNIHFYSVREKPIPYYATTNGYECYSVLNELTGEFVHAAGTVEWLGEVDESFRPKEVTVYLFRQYKDAQAEKIGTLTVKPDADGVWSYDFGVYPQKDTDGAAIRYTVEEDPVQGYTTKIDGFDVQNTRISYRITSGDGQHYRKESGQFLTFTCNGPLEKFTYITVDGNKVAPAQYTTVSGSTVLTFKEAWAEKAAVGAHTIRFYYTDAMSNEGRFYVDKPLPITGDDSHPWLYAGMALLSLAVPAVCVRKRRRVDLRKD